MTRAFSAYKHTTIMKQVIVELPDEDHAALKQRAAAQMRKLGAQLLFEAKLAAQGAAAARRRRTKGAAV